MIVVIRLLATPVKNRFMPVLHLTLMVGGSACGPSEAPGSPTRQPRWGGPAGGEPGEAGPPSESERGWGPASIGKDRGCRQSTSEGVAFLHHEAQGPPP